jgi:hypothetical protein
MKWSAIPAPEYVRSVRVQVQQISILSHFHLTLQVTSKQPTHTHTMSAFRSLTTFSRTLTTSARVFNEPKKGAFEQAGEALKAAGQAFKVSR